MRGPRSALLTLLVLAVLVPAMGAGAAEGFNFQAHLTADEEVPPNDSNATGQAVIRLSDDESTVSWRLIAANIENVFAAHIHCGAPGVNGPVRITLFSGAPAGGRFDGVLSTGSASVVGVTCPDGETLVASMRAGNTYVNVHTNDGDETPNEGPGDFPGGEIRGQLQVNG